MYQIAMDGPNVNLKFFDYIVKKEKEMSNMYL